MNKLSLLTVFASLLCAIPAHAEDEEKLGILAALGLTAAEGKTEVSDKGAELEGWILASGTLAKAAAAIAAVKPPTMGLLDDPKTLSVNEKRPLLLLSADAQFDLGTYYVARGNIKAALGAMADVSVICAIDTAASMSVSEGETEASNRSGNLRLATAIIGALKIDTKITGFDIGTPDAALLNLLSGALPNITRIPSDAIGSVDPNSELVSDFATMIKTQAEVEKCASRLPTTTEAEKKIKAKVTAASSGAGAVQESLAEFDKDAGSSLFNRALQAEPYVGGKFDVLRVKVEKAGGNLITRKNVFLQFGFPGALSLTAGTIVSYRYYNPSTGEVDTSGMLVCRAAERDWHAVQRGKIGGQACLTAAAASAQPVR